MDQIENNIALCPLCKNIYNTPRMLPCQHTFCESCLTDFIQNHAKLRKKRTPHFPCPSCERRTKLETNTEDKYNASQFPKNLTMQALLDSEPVMRKLKKISRKGMKEERNAKVENANEPPKGDGTLITINNTPIIGGELILNESAQDIVDLLNFHPIMFGLILIFIVYAILFLFLLLTLLLILLAYLFPTLFIFILIVEVQHAFGQLKIVRLIEAFKLCPKIWLLKCMVFVLTEFTLYMLILFGGMLILESVSVLSNVWYSGDTHVVLPSLCENTLIRSYNVLHFVNHKLTYDYFILLTIVSFSMIINVHNIYTNRIH